MTTMWGRRPLWAALVGVALSHPTAEEGRQLSARSHQHTSLLSIWPGLTTKQRLQRRDKAKALRARIPPPPPPRLPMLNPDWALWWLHFPKCGTSLRGSVLEYPWSKLRDLSWPQGNHQVLFADIGARITEPGVQAVAMFRQPEDRLESAYFHMRDQIRWDGAHGRAAAKPRPRVVSPTEPRHAQRLPTLPLPPPPRRPLCVSDSLAASVRCLRRPSAAAGPTGAGRCAISSRPTALLRGA